MGYSSWGHKESDTVESLSTSTLSWWLSSKNPPGNPRDPRDTCSLLGLGRSLGEGNGNPLQYSCLGNPLDREASQATVHGVAKIQTRLSN